jgi:SET domain-containing protein
MFRVLPSTIQGQGLFAECALRARSKLGEFTGQTISVKEARRKAKGAQRIVIVEISETEAIDGSNSTCIFQFVNHSCNPNVFIRVAHRRVEFYARRNIQPGEELTCDYGDSHHEGQLPCRCGSSNCRKFI